eukprot:GHUV01012433.1.p1 GENE.GHUV01012433.1~~GHUV01012433.1.p1  ORF type:complete len:455 (+),score=84.82 GHUV01012433.1:690-2054(+)
MDQPEATLYSNQQPIISSCVKNFSNQSALHYGAIIPQLCLHLLSSCAVYDWTFTTPLQQIQASNVYQAGNARFRRVVDKLMTGNPVKVVAIGGLATNGSDASNPGTDDYFALYVKFLKRAFPRARIDPVRSSAGIAPSAIVEQCLSSYLPSDADLVLLEMITNDGRAMDVNIVSGHNAKAYEMLMRSILQGSVQPALLLTQSLTFGMGNGSTPFYLTPEAPQYATLSSYYGTPVVSLRNAIWPSGNPNGNGEIVDTAIEQQDGAMPLSSGHKSMADMLVYNTQRTAEDLLLLPYGDYDRYSLAGDVPQNPVYSDVSADPGTVLSNSTCWWVKNISSDRLCPQYMHQMCSLDYSSVASMLRTYDEKVETSAPGPNAGMIAGIVAGVVGGLLILGGLLAYCIISKRRHAERVAAAAEAKAAARRKAGSASTVPITATSRVEGVNGTANGKDLDESV